MESPSSARLLRCERFISAQGPNVGETVVPTKPFKPLFSRPVRRGETDKAEAFRPSTHMINYAKPGRWPGRNGRHRGPPRCHTNFTE